MNQQLELGGRRDNRQLHAGSAVAISCLCHLISVDIQKLKTSYWPEEGPFFDI